MPDATAVVPGNAGDDLKYASNPTNFDADRTAGNNDQRHRLVLSGVYDTIGFDGLDGFMGTLARNWSFSMIFTAQSGQPYTARVGAVDLNGDGNTRNDIAPGTVRNQFRLESIVTFDPRVSREIPLGRARLQLIWEAFNLFNRDNISGVDTTYYSVSNTTTLTQDDDVRPSAGECGRADHAAGGEDYVLRPLREAAGSCGDTQPGQSRLSVPGACQRRNPAPVCLNRVLTGLFWRDLARSNARGTHFLPVWAPGTVTVECPP